jgi:hypothetical protein
MINELIEPAVLSAVVRSPMESAESASTFTVKEYAK